MLVVQECSESQRDLPVSGGVRAFHTDHYLRCTHATEDNGKGATRKQLFNQARLAEIC